MNHHNNQVNAAWHTLVAAGDIVPSRRGLGWRGLCIGRWSR